RLALEIHVDQSVAPLDANIDEVGPGQDVRLVKRRGCDDGAASLQIDGGRLKVAVVIDVEGDGQSRARALLAEGRIGEIIGEVEAEAVGRVSAASAHPQLEGGDEAGHGGAGIEVIDQDGSLLIIDGVGQADVTAATDSAAR